MKEDKGWSPYLAGALSGLVTIFSAWISGYFLGASATFVRIAGLIEKFIDPERIKGMYYGYITIPQILGINHWFIITAFIIGCLALFRWFEKKGL